MGGEDAEAVLLQILAADAEHDNALAAVDKIFLVARLQGIAELVFGEAVFLCDGDGGVARFALGLAVVEELLISLGKGKHLLQFLFRGDFKVILFLVGQIVELLLSFALFSHD